MSWGWRVPFILSVVLIGLGLWVQLRLEDTVAFRKLKETRQPQSRTEISARPERSPVLAALRRYPRQIALAAGAFMATQVTFYILIAFILAYGSNPAGLGLPRSTMLAAVLIGAVAMIPALLAAAAISDRYGRRGIYMAGALLLGLWGFALFPLVDTGSFLWITVAISVGQVLVAMMYGPQAAFFAEMFSTEVRYSGASLGYQFGAIVGGALAPIIATALLAEFGSTFGISVYIAIACAVSLVSVRMLTETYRNDLHEPRATN
jgi:MFS family permease